MTTTIATAIVIAEFCTMREDCPIRVVDGRWYDNYYVAREAVKDAITAIDGEVRRVMRTIPTTTIVEVSEEVEDYLAWLASERKRVAELFEDYKWHMWD